MPLVTVGLVPLIVRVPTEEPAVLKSKVFPAVGAARVPVTVSVTLRDTVEPGRFKTEPPV